MRSWLENWISAELINLVFVACFAKRINLNHVPFLSPSAIVILDEVGDSFLKTWLEDDIIFKNDMVVCRFWLIRDLLHQALVAAPVTGDPQVPLVIGNTSALKVGPLSAVCTKGSPLHAALNAITVTLLADASTEVRGLWSEAFFKVDCCELARLDVHVLKLSADAHISVNLALGIDIPRLHFWLGCSRRWGNKKCKQNSLHPVGDG